MSSLNDKRPAYVPLAKRDRAKQEFLRRKPTAFPTRQDRDAFLIESLKASAVSDLHRLVGLIGREGVGKWMAQDPDLASFIRREVLEKK